MPRMISTLLSLIFALTSSAASIAPASPQNQTSFDCDVSNATLQLPSGQTQLTLPNTTTSFIALAVGVQNYTCSNTSTYTNIGAVAELFDISCLYSTPLFNTLPNITYAAWNITPPSITSFELISAFANDPVVLGQHYYVTNPLTGSGVSPKWDFTSARFKGNPLAYVIGARVGDIPAPTGREDVDWLEVNAVQGDLANVVFRVQTRGGQPPAECTPGSPLLSVKYTAQYWFYGGSLV